MEGISGLGVACTFKLAWDPAAHPQQSLICSSEYHRVRILWICSWQQSCVQCMAGLMTKEGNVLSVELEIC